MDSSSPRNIVLLSDGTGNSRGKAHRTNVWRVYEALDLADPQPPGEPRQYAFYDDGVGSSSFPPWALLGGALGLGLARNVRDLYGYLCRTYRPGFVARSSWELFLYVNDAVGPPGLHDWFYRKNRGTAQGTIARVAVPPEATPSQVAATGGHLRR